MDRSGIQDSGSNAASEDEEGMTGVLRAGADARVLSNRSGMPGGASELSGALSFFLKRAQLESESGGSPGQLSSILRELKSGNSTRQVVALTELSEHLSFSSEDGLISFPMETFIPVLVNLMESSGAGDETSAQVMLLACRSLYNIVDILPPTARIITAVGGLPILCANLLNIEYIDVAELTVAIIEWIAEDQPIQVLKAGGLQAILTFLDFFQMSVQRQGANAAALMLVPMAPADVFEQQVRPALPILVAMLQHSDPQVLQSALECWRRLIDNTVAATRPGGGAEHRNGAVADVLEALCPEGLLSNLLLQLGNGVSAPTPSSSVMVSEVLYIIAVLTNYSDAFTKEVLQHDLCAILQKIMLQVDFAASGRSSTSQNDCLLGVLGLVASVLPAVSISDSRCSCDERRLDLFQVETESLDKLGEAFLPRLVVIYEAAMDAKVQSLCVTLLLAFLLACRNRPEVIRRGLEPTPLSCFLANLLLGGVSSSVSLACLLAVRELLGCHDGNSLLFARHGVVWAMRHLARDELGEAGPKTEDAQPGSGMRSSTAHLKETARQVLSNYESLGLPSGETAIMQTLRNVAQQLQSSPNDVVPAHSDALSSLRELLLAQQGITTFELSCSGAADALNLFLFPPADLQSSDDTQRSRLRLFLQCVAKPEGGALLKLVRLCVSAVQRIELQPFVLFSPQGSVSMPPHLRPLRSASPASPFSAARPGPAVPGSSVRAGGAGSLGERMWGLRGLAAAGGGTGRGHGIGGSGLLSVLKLLAKPVRVRMMPHGASMPSPSANPGRMTKLQGLLSTSVSVGRGAGLDRNADIVGTSPNQAMLGISAASASSAARLRNFLASQVSRKRPVPSSPFEQREQGSEESRLEAFESALHDKDYSLAEEMEAVLLVEPFAQVAALEDYVWDKYGSGPAAGGAGKAPQDGALAGKPEAKAAPRHRLTGKQPPQALTRERHAPSQTSPMSADSDAARVASPRADQSPAAADADSCQRPARGQANRGDKVVRIYLNGQLLTSKTSIVQSLVGQVGMPQAAVVERHSSGAGRKSQSPSHRFMALVEDGSSSDGDTVESWMSNAGMEGSSKKLCASIWGRVHCMTYEIVQDPAHVGKAATEAASSSLTQSSSVAACEFEAATFVHNEFDGLVWRHKRIAHMMRDLPSSRDVASTETDEKAPGTNAALLTMLQLLSAFHCIGDYLRSTEDLRLAVEDDAFHCASLTAMLLKQLSDPLAVCTGSVPSWCTSTASACRFLYPYSVRKTLHHSCNLGLGRALHHVQQRALVQHAHSQEALRRLEGEVAVASIPRQKVRISRQRILDSAVKVMSLYGAGSAILEVEYVGEVGTGSGPTLEFYAQVAELLRTSEPRLFRQNVPGGMLFPEPQSPDWLRQKEDPAAKQILERFRLLGHVVAKCILDSRLVDVQLHPLFWQAVLARAPFSQRSLLEVDPVLYASLQTLQSASATLEELGVDFTLPGHPQLELKLGGAGSILCSTNLQEYIELVSEFSLVTAVEPQVAAFREAFKELLPLSACQIWSEKELSSLIVGASVHDDSFWTLEHLGGHIKAQHGYSANSRCFRDLLTAMSEFTAEDRRSFLTFVTGAASLPVGGFAGLKPPLTVVKKESPPPPLTTDQFMPSVMTCANYLKLPEYSSSDILRQKLTMAMQEGQSAFLLS